MRDTQKHTELETAITESSVLSTALTVECDIFKVEKELMKRKFDKLKPAPSFRLGSQSDGKLSELRQTYGAHICALNDKRSEFDLRNDGLQWQASTRNISHSGPYSEVQKSNILLCYRTRAVASRYSILLGLCERIAETWNATRWAACMVGYSME